MRAHFEQVSLDHAAHDERRAGPVSYVEELAALEDRHGRMPSPFGTVENPIRMMEREHRDAADELGAIRELTRGYAAPPTAARPRSAWRNWPGSRAICTATSTSKNNVLFPKAISLESASGLRE